MTTKTTTTTTPKLAGEAAEQLMMRRKPIQWLRDNDVTTSDLLHLVKRDLYEVAERAIAEAGITEVAKVRDTKQRLANLVGMATAAVIANDNGEASKGDLPSKVHVKVTCATCGKKVDLDDALGANSGYKGRHFCSHKCIAEYGTSKTVAKPADAGDLPARSAQMRAVKSAKAKAKAKPAKAAQSDAKNVQVVNGEATSPLHFQCPRSLRTALQDKAKELGMSRSDLLRQIVERAIDAWK